MGSVPASVTSKAPTRAQRLTRDRSIGAQNLFQPVVGDVHFVGAGSIGPDIIGVEDDVELLAGPAIAIRFAQQLGEVGGLERIVEARLVNELLLEVGADELAHDPEPLF